MALNLANVQSNDTFQTWFTRTNEIIGAAAPSDDILLKSGGTITGNLTVAGDAVFNGNTTIVSKTTISTTDALIQLASNNEISDTLDIGFFAHFQTGSGNNHTGLIRDSGTKEYYLFGQYIPGSEPTDNIDVNHPSFDLANVHVQRLTSNAVVTHSVTATGDITSDRNITANSFIGDGSQLTNAGSSVAIDGGTGRELFVPFTGISNGTMTSANVDAQFTFNPGTQTLSANSTATVFNVTNSGAAAYQFNGGGTSTNNNPTLLLSRGKVYKFNVNASGHPFYIKTVNSTGNGSQYNDGVTNNGAETGLITFQVPNHAPSVLHYNCSVHASMNGRIIIDSGFEYDETANAMFANSVKTSSLKDSSNRTLTIRDEANTIVWGG